MCVCVCVCSKGGTLDVVAPFFMCRSTKYLSLALEIKRGCLMTQLLIKSVSNLNSQAFAEVLMCTKGRFFSAGFCYEYCADGYEAL